MSWILLLAIQDVTVDGHPAKPLRYSIDPQTDVVVIERIPMVVPAGRALEFTTQDERVLLDGAVAAVRVKWTYEGDTRVVINPLEKMSDDQIRGLRGLWLAHWDEKIEANVKLLDPSRTCVTVTNDCVDDRKALVQLPKTLEHLAIEEWSNPGIQDFATLSSLTSLKSLVIHSLGETVDLELLKPCTKLRSLDLTGNDLVHLADLMELKDLRELRLGWSKGVTSIAFVKELKELRLLDVRRTRVADLSPLDGLEKIEWIDASSTAASRLPAGTLPRLQRLNLMSSKLSDEDVAAFAKLHPKAQILHRWDQVLQDALAGVDRIRVRSGGTCHGDDNEKTLFEEKDAEKIKVVLSRFAVDEKKSNFACGCCGEPTFEFYRGAVLVASVGMHHGRSVRWPGGWPADGLLTDASAEFLCDWLAEHGVEGPRKERKGK